MVRGKCFRKWKKNLSGFWTSGLTSAEYCRRTHLNEKSAGRWMNRFKSLGYEKKVTEGILEIVPLKTVLIGTEQKDRSGIRTPLYDRMGVIIDGCDIIHCDETTIRLLVPGNGKSKTAFLWLKMTAVGPPLAVFRFADSSSKETAEKFLQNYCGTITGSEGGGQNFAILASFAASCKLNHIGFGQWLNNIMIRLPDTPISQLDSLLPNQWFGN